MILKSLKSAERFISNQQDLGSTVKWDGWDIVFFHPNDYAAMTVESRVGRAVFNRDTGRWGFETRVSPNTEGQWEVDHRNVRHSRRPRNRR